jgi:hypothetical protein
MDTYKLGSVLAKRALLTDLTDKSAIQEFYEGFIRKSLEAGATKNPATAMSAALDRALIDIAARKSDGAEQQTVS